MVMLMSVSLIPDITFANQSDQSASNLTISDYSTEDINTINSLIETNNLKETKSSPNEWTFAVWDEESPKRIISLNLINRGLKGKVDLSSLKNIEFIDLSENNITQLEVLNANSLMKLECTLNNLESLKVSGENVNYLGCFYNNLSNLDLTGLPNLKKLNFGFNRIENINMSNIYLEELSCSFNRLTNLDVRHMTNMKRLECDNNKLTSLDLTGENLEGLYIFGNNLTSLYIPQMTKLINFDCGKNPIKSIDLSKLPNLISFKSYKVNWTSVITKEGTKLTAPDDSSIQIEYGLYGYDDEYKKYPQGVFTLTAKLGKGQRFNQWNFPADSVHYIDGTSQNSNPTKVIIHKDVHVKFKLKSTPISKLKFKKKKIFLVKKGKKYNMAKRLKIYPSNATNKKVRWKSSNKKVVTVNKKGIIKAKKKKGKAKITAFATDGSGKKATITVYIGKRKSK